MYVATSPVALVSFSAAYLLDTFALPLEGVCRASAGGQKTDNFFAYFFRDY